MQPKFKEAHYIGKYTECSEFITRVKAHEAKRRDQLMRYFGSTSP